MILPRFTGSYITEVSVNEDGSVYAFGEYEQSGCGWPRIVRVRPGGTLDTRFDSTMVRSFMRVASRQQRFTPTFVPRSRSGEFVLIGGLDKTCGAFRRFISGGIAVGIRPSGWVDRSYGHNGKTRFPSPSYAFDSPLAIRLRSGRILAAAEVYASSGREKGVIVRAFSSDGSIDRGFGKAGARTIGRKALPRNAYLVALEPAPNGEAWLVVGSRDEVELIPV